FLAKEKERFHAELQDDFNTPGGLAVIQEIIGEAYRRNDPGAMRQAAQLVRELGRPLGLFQGEGASAELGKLSEELLDLIVELRTILRQEKNFALADMIREKLGKLGVELRDGPEGTRWVLRT
ncbi:cysteine--tRNA ligase, partial [bacterium]|nr:cysteine--tRNA ligase [bacterium]